MKSLDKSAIVLLSGGLDSTTAAALARRDGYRLYGLTIAYGQVHAAEIAAARRVAEALGLVEHRILSVDFGSWGGSALVNQGTPAAIPLDRQVEEMSREIPVTYVPARNTIFLSLALGWAETLGAAAIFLGVNAVDYSGYPDCRPEFLAAFENLARLATKQGVEKGICPKIEAPLLRMTKSEIIKQGMALGLDYGMTHSCYKPDAQDRACGRCDSCLLRKKGFAEAGLTDPARYA